MKTEDLLVALGLSKKGEMSSGAKTAIAITACIVGIIVFIFLWKKFKKYSGLVVDQVKEQELIDEANKTIEVSDLSYPQDQYTVYAEKLVAAMEGWGTDEDAIYDVYKAMNTRSDIKQLEKTFGMQDGESLQEWLYGDLNNSEITHLNSIISSKGIDYRY